MYRKRKWYAPGILLSALYVSPYCEEQQKRNVLYNQPTVCYTWLLTTQHCYQRCSIILRSLTAFEFLLWGHCESKNFWLLSTILINKHTINFRDTSLLKTCIFYFCKSRILSLVCNGPPNLEKEWDNKKGLKSYIRNLN